MQFVWDEAKRRANLRKHGLPFELAPHVFEDFALTTIDDRFDYGGTRFVTVGQLQDRIVVVVYTETDEERIVSFRKALAHERDHYWRNHPRRLGSV